MIYQKIINTITILPCLLFWRSGGKHTRAICACATCNDWRIPLRNLNFAGDKFALAWLVFQELCKLYQEYYVNYVCLIQILKYYLAQIEEFRVQETLQHRKICFPRSAVWRKISRLEYSMKFSWHLYSACISYRDIQYMWKKKNGACLFKWVYFCAFL